MGLLFSCVESAELLDVARCSCSAPGGRCSFLKLVDEDAVGVSCAITETFLGFLLYPQL